MRSAMAREPHFDCADAQVPAAGDVLHDLEDDDLEDATMTSDGLVQLGRRIPTGWFSSGDGCPALTSEARR